MVFTEFCLCKGDWLTFKIVYISHDDHMEKFIVSNVGGSDGHHQVSEANQRTVYIRKHSYDDVVLQIQQSERGFVIGGQKLWQIAIFKTKANQKK